jgi:hypothetical protein
MTTVAAGALHSQAVSSTASATPIDGGLLLAGDSNLEGKVDTASAGTAAAFRYTASASGSAAQIWVYLHNTSAASQVVVGLYTDNSGSPGALLAQGTISSPTAGVWNSATIPTTPLTAGTVYWIAILAPTGS